jgi:gas vesicle protein
MSGKSNVFIVAVTGLAVGIGIGLLIAPEKGAKTRKKIRDRILDIADKLEDGFLTNFEEIRDVFSSGKNSGENEKDTEVNTAERSSSV